MKVVEWMWIGSGCGVEVECLKFLVKILINFNLCVCACLERVQIFLSILKVYEERYVRKLTFVIC